MKNEGKLKVIEMKNLSLDGVDAVGIADYENKTILIDPTQNPYDYLNTLVHELLHHLNPSWTETKIIWYANRISRFLWRHNYRQVKQ